MGDEIVQDPQTAATPTVRAKFKVDAVEFYGDHTNPETARSFTLRPIHDTSTEEHRRFTKYTPSGELRMRVDNPAVQLAVGQLFYVDFTPAE